MTTSNASARRRRRGRRVGERADEVVELEDGAGPAVHEDQGMADGALLLTCQ